jgi:hypothetical protein
MIDSDNIPVYLFLAFIIILMVAGIWAGVYESNKRTECNAAMSAKGFIQVKYMGQDIWIHSKDLSHLIEVEKP